MAEAEPPEPVALARLCSAVENDWTGAQTGLLDQLAVLCAEPRARAAHRHARAAAAAPCRSTWATTCWPRSTLAPPRSLASSGYNERREECRAACRALGVDSLRDATGAEGLPEPLRRRVRHVLTENERVDAAVAALEAGDLAGLGELLDGSHRSLRDDYEVSVPEVERAVEACKDAGALGARIMGGGFGGSVLALFPPGAQLPGEAPHGRAGASGSPALTSGSSASSSSSTSARVDAHSQNSPATTTSTSPTHRLMFTPAAFSLSASLANSPAPTQQQRRICRAPIR